MTGLDRDLPKINPTVMISVFEQESIDLTKLDPDVDQFKVNYYKS